jgi:hypothetical protein
MMYRRALIIGALALLTGEALAFPIEGITTLFTKLFKGSSVSKEAVNVGRVGEGASATKAAEHLSAGDKANHAASSSIQAVIEPKANTLIEPVGQDRKDLDFFKSLRASAITGDSTAMLQMSELIASGKVSDPGEPYYFYWLIQATRAGSQSAIRRFNDECSRHEDKRKSDRWFDLACGNRDGKNLYTGASVTHTYSPSKTSLEILNKR